MRRPLRSPRARHSPAPPLSLGRVPVPAPPAARPGSHVLTLFRALPPRQNGPSVARLPPRRGPDRQTVRHRQTGGPLSAQLAPSPPLHRPPHSQRNTSGRVTFMMSSGCGKTLGGG